MAKRRRSVGRKRARFGRKTKHNLMLMRTRNLGVVGTRGAGVIAWTKGAYANLNDAVIRLKLMITQDDDMIVMEDGTTNISPER